MKPNKRTIKLNESQLRDIIKESIKDILMNEETTDHLNVASIEEYAQEDPSTLSDSELQNAVEYMLAYRWALYGYEDVLDAYINEAKRRGL